MKVLLHLNNPLGLGADRWVMMGYRYAFEKLGYETIFFTEKDDLEESLEKHHPDIFMTNTAIVEEKRNGIDILKKARAMGMKVAMNVGEDYEQKKNVLIKTKNEKAIDLFFSTYAEEVMGGFERTIGFPYLFLPLAANSLIQFPEKSDPQWRADISFVGARLATKEHMFKKVLLPLHKKYDVKVYGPGWTQRDKFLRLVSGFGRKTKLFSWSDWANKKRLLISQDQERAIYASSKICINIHEYNNDGSSKNLSNEREFKIPACGGFQISDYVVGIERFFIPNKEIVLVKYSNNWGNTIDYYMKNEQERIKIQNEGTKRAMHDHTYSARVATLLKALDM